ncbi:MAG: hypothetical protein ACI9KE_000864 [Polyangiales bacterium]
MNAPRVATKKKTKKPKKRLDPSNEELPGTGTEHGAILQQAHDAFVAGNYSQVRELTTKLEKAPDEIALAAGQLRRRVDADPAQIAVLVSCFVFFLFIVWKYVL